MTLAYCACRMPGPSGDLRRQKGLPMIGNQRVTVIAAALLLGFASVLAQSQQVSPQFGSSHSPKPPGGGGHSGPPAPVFGAPLSGLTSAQLADFADGLGDFQEVDTPDTGLGPIFNNTSCVACHSVPAPGGGSAIFETRFGQLVNGVFDPLAALGGSLLQQFAIDPAAQEFIPSAANVFAKRLTTPLFGAGLIEAIPDATILGYAALPKPDGIVGRAAMVVDVTTGETRVGRFGWKAQQATLLAFAGDAYLNEIGITNRFFPQENAPNGDQALLQQFDTVADPEDAIDPSTGKADIDHFADFMRMLAPPPPKPLSKSAVAGAVLFLSVGCATCHLPVMVTGPSTIAALDHKLVPLYSDLLLHNMGSLGDGIGQAAAMPSEMKTPPLWGLHVRGPYLHDGRAATVDAAILQHDGEAATVRNRYSALPSVLKQQLLAFLGSL